jgi:dihydrofolate synthase/folylpolyglutamate synthase
MVIAFLFFEEIEVEYAIIEVWLWGRLDSTNIVNPFVTCITSISLDHEDVLWNTLDKISFEKAGIIKENVPLFLNIKNKVIEKRAKEKKAQIIFTNKEVDNNLNWGFQKENAALAYEIAKYIWVKENIISEWLQEIKHIWRLQFIKNNLLVDWAHNEDGLKQLKKYVEENLIQKFDKIYYCFSIKKRKKYRFSNK